MFWHVRFRHQHNRTNASSNHHQNIVLVLIFILAQARCQPRAFVQDIPAVTRQPPYHDTQDCVSEALAPLAPHRLIRFVRDACAAFRFKAMRQLFATKDCSHIHVFYVNYRGLKLALIRLRGAQHICISLKNCIECWMFRMSKFWKYGCSKCWKHL